MKNCVVCFFAPLLFVVDFFLKKQMLAKAAVSFPGESFFHLSILPFVNFDLTYVENTGMAWGMFASFQSVILFLRVILILAIILGLFKFKKMQQNIGSYLLIIFGAMGNVTDTLLYGYVIDMLHFTFWGRSYGIFNVADAMIFLGVFMIAFSKEKPHAAKE